MAPPRRLVHCTTRELAMTRSTRTRGAGSAMDAHHLDRQIHVQTGARTGGGEPCSSSIRVARSGPLADKLRRQCAQSPTRGTTSVRDQSAVPSALAATASVTSTAFAVGVSFAIVSHVRGFSNHRTGLGPLPLRRSSPMIWRGCGVQIVESTEVARGHRARSSKAGVLPVPRTLSERRSIPLLADHRHELVVAAGLCQTEQVSSPCRIATELRTALLLVETAMMVRLAY